MRKTTSLLFSGILAASAIAAAQLYSEETETPEIIAETTAKPEIQPEKPQEPFVDFTGKIAKDRVRLRLQPSLESPIIREMDRDELVLVTGTTDDFLAVMPPREVKAYVYKSFVVDDTVQGNRVNVRLNPTLEAPVIAQLNSGDKIEGTICAENNKWLEIKIPESLRLYVSKDYVVKIGDATLISSLNNRKQEVRGLLKTTSATAQLELEKPFPEIHLDGVYADLNKIVSQYEDFPHETKQAKELLKHLQDTYLQKKVGYLESQKENVAHDLKDKNTKLAEVEQKLNHVNNENSASEFYKEWLTNQDTSSVTEKMRLWIPVEIAHFQEWSKEHQDRTIRDFYQDERQRSVALSGVIEAFERPVRNKPGDYILINRMNRLPIAYLYSTQINLQDFVGKEVTVEAAARPNNHFAYPAYFILRAE